MTPDSYLRVDHTSESGIPTPFWCNSYGLVATSFLAWCSTWEGTRVSRARVIVLCIAIGLTSLVSNSMIAYALQLKPAIFDGLIFYVLSAACLVCWLVYAKACSVDRAEQRDEDERVGNFATAVHYARKTGRPG